MPDCPNCGTWNPDDKLVCWRCQTEMPKPQPKKKKPLRIMGMPVWSWVILALMVAFWLLVTCLGPQLSTPAGG